MKNSSRKVCKFGKKPYLCIAFETRDIGRLAQLVQSICLTSRGSAVRIRQRPPKSKHRGVEQLVARWAHNPKVVCSSQASATTRRSKCFSLFLCPETPISFLFVYFFQIACENQRNNVILHTYICNVQKNLWQYRKQELN